jgi:hypothetical protein
MESNKKLIQNQLLKIFLIITLVLIIIFLIIYNYDLESFTDINKEPIDKVLNSINIKKLNYSKSFSQNIFNDKAYQLTKKALKDNELKKIIESKMIEIYGEIINNESLKQYLKFINLINEEGKPIFMNESEEVLLLNKVKILLIVMNNNINNMSI